MFPGLGLGVIVAGAKQVSKNMLDAAAKVVARQVDPTVPDARLRPDVTNLRSVSSAVAEAVCHAAVEDGVATKMHDDVMQAILDAMWVAEYAEDIR